MDAEGDGAYILRTGYWFFRERRMIDACNEEDGPAVRRRAVKRVRVNEACTHTRTREKRFRILLLTLPAHSLLCRFEPADPAGEEACETHLSRQAVTFLQAAYDEWLPCFSRGEAVFWVECMLSEEGFYAWQDVEARLLAGGCVYVEGLGHTLALPRGRF